MSGVNQSISAGIGGFLAFFLLASALWLLMRNMNTRLRNLKYNEEAEEARLAREKEQSVVARPATGADHTGAGHTTAGHTTAGHTTADHTTAERA